MKRTTDNKAQAATNLWPAAGIKTQEDDKTTAGYGKPSKNATAK